AIALPPALFTGLLISLWIQKCIALVVFQNRIIYMPGMPPNSSLERIEDYQRQCRGVQWREEKICAQDGTHLFLCVASVDSCRDTEKPLRPVYVLYFQGNAGSTPPRLPDLSAILTLLQTSIPNARFTLICLSYRGYWKSSGRPHEAGLNTDAAAAYSWTLAHHSRSALHAQPPLVVLWGHSIGAAIASSLAARVFAAENSQPLPLKGLVLETPFVSARAMLAALYPQKWLPYKHLWPFLRNPLDTEKSLQIIAASGRGRLKVDIVQAARDELVPESQAEQLEEQCRRLNIDVMRTSVAGAFHNEASYKPQGRMAIVAAIENALGSL
ncbi:hypothetical protein TD95_000028, partial [Thielaviopsis punctulata]